MSFFNEVNRETRVDAERDVTSGPRLGFLGAFEAAWDAQTKTESFYADAAAFDTEEARQFYKIKEAGLEPPPRMTNRGFSLRGMGVFEDVASYYNNGENADAVANDLTTRNQHIEKLRQQRPDLGLQTYDELWSTVRKKAKAAEDRWEQAETSFGGAVGGFLGQMAGAMNPVTDPLNAATLGVGGVGRRALTRIATEAGGQSLVEGVNQFTGVSAGRERLGLETSFARSAEQVAAVGIGAGVLRGAAEGAGRWFRGAPKDPAPAIPPKDLVPVLPEAPARLEYPLEHYLGGSRRAQTILDVELASVGKQLDDGVPPWAVKPHTETALPRDILAPDARVPTSTIEQLIERADPETWRLYSRLQEKADSLRSAIEAVSKIVEDAGSTSALKQLDEQLAALAATAANAKGKKLAKLETEMAALQEQRGPLAERVSAGSGETAVRRQSELRQNLANIDEQMRELALPLSRARAAGEERFLAQQVDPDVAALLRKNNPGSEILQKAKWNEAPIERIDLSPARLEDKVPRRPTDPPDATPQARAELRVKEDAAFAETRVEALATFAKQNLADVAELSLPDGRTVPLGTTIMLEGADGTSRSVTLRDMLREVNEDNSLLESVASCSLAKIS